MGLCWPGLRLCPATHPRVPHCPVASPVGVCGLKHQRMQNGKEVLRFVVLGANTPWVYALAEALAQTYATSAIRVYDWRTYYRDNVRWPNGEVPARLARRTWLFPPGHLGVFRALFSRIMAVRLRNLLT